MSYCILYKRIFIRTKDDKYIVLVEAGDNNVWDTDSHTGHEKRSRSWEAWNFNENKFAFSEKEINAWLQERLKMAIDRAAEDGSSIKQAAKAFGWYRAYALAGKTTHTTTFGMFNNFFSPSKGTVISFDEFVRNFGGLHITYWTDTYHITKSFSTEDALLEEFNSLRKSTNATLWIKPDYTHNLNEYCEIKFGKSKLSVTLEACYKNPLEGTKVKYVKTILPLQLTTEKKEAVTVAYSSIEGIFEIIRNGLRKKGYELDSLSYQKA